MVSFLFLLCSVFATAAPAPAQSRVLYESGTWTVVRTGSQLDFVNRGAFTQHLDLTIGCRPSERLLMIGLHRNDSGSIVSGPLDWTSFASRVVRLSVTLPGRVDGGEGRYRFYDNGSGDPLTSLFMPDRELSFVPWIASGAVLSVRAVGRRFGVPGIDIFDAFLLNGLPSLLRREGCAWW